MFPPFLLEGVMVKIPVGNTFLTSKNRWEMEGAEYTRQHSKRILYRIRPQKDGRTKFYAGEGTIGLVLPNLAFAPGACSSVTYLN